MSCSRVTHQPWTAALAVLATMLAIPGTLRADFMATGAFTTKSQVEHYTIFITDPSAFSATVATGITPPALDTMMWLFTAAGVGVESNDDTLNNMTQYDPRSTLPAGNPFSPTTPGQYELYMTTWRNAPFAANNMQIFANTDNEGVFGPTLNLPLASFLESQPPYMGELFLGPYTLVVTGATPIPEPAALTLFLTCAVGLSAYRLRRRAR